MDLKYEDGFGGNIIQWIVHEDGIDVFLQITEPKSAVEKFTLRVRDQNYSAMTSTILLAISKGSSIRVFARDNKVIYALIGYL
jgi:hypothetical protein